MTGLALQLLRYAEADEANARHLRPGPTGDAIAARAAVLRAAAEALAPGIDAAAASAAPAPAELPADEIAGDDLAASRALIPR